MRARIGVVFLALALSASADQANMDVGAELIGTCKIDGVVPIDFGDLPQSATSPDRTAVGAVLFWCSKGLRYKINVDDGLHSSKGSRRMMGEGPVNALEYLSYDLRPHSPEHDTGRGPLYPVLFEMLAEVKGINYDPLSVGPLRDTVVVTITP